MFARIAGRYDALCDVFSLFIHRLWKARIARRIAAECQGVILDAASGTGDIPVRLLRRLSKNGRGQRLERLLVTDLCPQMLALAEPKLAGDARVEITLADACDLNGVADGSVDAYAISFAMKILDRPRVLSEALRVLRPGGRFYCLEASRISNQVIHGAYLRYMDLCLPLIGRLATGGDRGAYDYFLRGIHGFPDERAFAEEIRNAGFDEVAGERLTFGVVAMHTARKPL